jgi:murein DD-endopeptidase MepM/ murein hydrolase activator NlpD
VVIANAAARFQNAPFLGTLLDILAHPTRAEHPDLRHFRLAEADPALGGSAWPPAPADAGAPHPSRLIWALVAAMAATLLAGLLTAGRRRRLLRWPGRRPPGPSGARSRPRLMRRSLGMRRRGLAVALGLAPLAAVATLVAGAASVSPAGARSHAAASLGTTGYQRAEVTAEDAVGAGHTGPQTWTQLLGIERGLAAQQAELISQEAEIARLAHLVAVHVPDPDQVTVGDGSFAAQSARLGPLIGARQATEASYNDNLRNEYELFRSAAQSPPQRDALIASAATIAIPEVRDAVAYDLSLVQTQLTQEASIAAVEAQLQQIGSLATVQLDAIRHHQQFIAPEVAPVTQGFGPTTADLEGPMTYHGTFFPHFHTGLDLAGPMGAPVHAAADGVVLLATASVDQTGKLVGYGNYVVIAHPDGFVTVYGHLQSIAVKAGQVVHQGQIIGYEGSTGWSTGPHLHFEIRHRGDWMDPAAYLAGQLS